MSQAAPAISLQGHVDKRWLVFTRVLAIAALLGTCAWWLLLWQHGVQGLWERVLVPAAVLIGVAVVWPLARVSPWELRWDGSTWHFGSFQGSLNPARVHVALDLDLWVLLRITRPREHQWLALSKRDHLAAWHGLRCALYCARPSSAHHAEPPGGSAPDRAA